MIVATLLVFAAYALASPHSYPDSGESTHRSCFPSLDFSMPDYIPDTTDDWWCPYADEYAFMGFSYEVTPCQSRDRLTREFKDIRESFGGRYVRMYGACDRDGFYDDVVDAAWEAGVGVHALIWVSTILLSLSFTNTSASVRLRRHRRLDLAPRRALQHHL